MRPARSGFSIRLACAVVLAVCLAGCVAAPASPDHKPGYVLAFADEFDGTELDRGKWNDCCIDFKSGPGVVGKDKFAYVPGNVSVSGGCLRIACTKETITCPNAGGGSSTVAYRSGQVQTKDKFKQKYGWWEARIKFPGARSLLPAFWLMPHVAGSMIGQQGTGTGDTAEVDIMEHHTHWMGNEVSSALWWGGYGERHQGRNIGMSRISDARTWHVYALNWEPGKLEIYVDGVKTQTHTGDGVPFGEEIVILSMAVASWDKPVIDSELPSSMLVDYVRVYQNKGLENAR